MFPRFEARAPWWGGDLQTLRNFLVPLGSDLSRYSSRRLVFPLRDRSGDRLVAYWNKPASADTKPLVILVHGLTGCSESRYMRASAGHFLRRGFPVLRLNLRGAGESRATCRFLYHAGRTADLRDAIAGLEPALKANGVLLAAFSLGANMVLKYVAEEGSAQGVRGAAAVSAPIDLAEAARCLLQPRNAAYHFYLLASMKTESMAPHAELSWAEREAILTARTVYQFDDLFTAPRNGFEGAIDYYRRNMALRFLKAVAVPTLVVHAEDDPWIPACSYRAFDWSSNPRLTLLLADSGGHVGFLARDDDVPWHDRCMSAYFVKLIG